MTSPPADPQRALVTALLVTHEGARWLPAVLDGLTSQRRPVDRVVAVDTGSTDGSADLVRDRLAAQLVGDVAVTPPSTGYGAAVEVGLEAAPATDDDEWVWLLHDDSNPAPEALEQLLDHAARNPEVDILGPKLREWPSLRRLLEVGVTLSGTGRRETGLERGEYDQGQHDRVHDVLAVNTAGMLVRRRVLESLKFDRRLPLFGNDIDFGWRAARAGHRAIAVPDAVVFHVEAAHRGRRTSALARHGHRRPERSAAIYTLLVNCSALALPFQVVRLLLGSFVRALGLLLVRAPGEAADELAGLASTYVHPLRIMSGRRARRRSATVPARDVRHLLAPPWLPYRHGLDFLSDVAAAVANQASDLSAARKARSASSVPVDLSGDAVAETGPIPEEAQTLPADTGLVARLVTSRLVWALAALTVAALVAARGLYGAGVLSGGALLPAPSTARSWWGLYLESFHHVGVGSTAPTAPYVLPLAVLGTVLLGKAWLVIDLVLLLAVPIAAAGAYRFLVRTTSSRPMSLWGAVAYGVLPVVMGAVQQGRLGTVAGALVLPWLAHSALFLSSTQSADRRARAAWRTSLWLALLVAFVPVAWLIAVLVALVMVVARLRRRSSPALALGSLVPPLAAIVLLLPWSLTTWSHRGLVSWLFEAGLPSPTITGPLSRLDVLLGRPADGAPWWATAGVVVAAVVALLRRDTRPAVIRAWVVVVVALGLTVALAGGQWSLDDDPVDQPLWLGFPLLVAQAAAICAVALAGTGIRRRLSTSSFGWRQPLGVVVVVVALVTPVVAVLWWVSAGSGGPLDRQQTSDVPTYMTDAATRAPGTGTLVVRGSRAGGFDYVLLHRAGIRLGDDSVEPPAAAGRQLTTYVTDLATAPQAADITGLSRAGVAYIYAPPPADIGLVGNLDSVSGVSSASAVRPGARAWQLDPATGPDVPAAHPDTSRRWLLVAQGLAVLVVVVLAVPSRGTRR